MERHGAVIRLRPEKTEEYLALHASVWPDIQQKMFECNIRNYTIFYRDGWLFNYYEYIGDDHAADMERIAADPLTQKWWELCMPCQEPVADRAPGEWWASMPEAYHQD